MEIIKIVNTETYVDLRLTQTEFNTIVATYGESNFGDCKKFGEFNNIKILEHKKFMDLYKELKKLTKEL